MATSKPTHHKVSYFHHDEIGNFHYGIHPMKPHRMRMTDSIVKSYDLHDHMHLIDQNVSFPEFYPSQEEVPDFDMTKFHSDDYIDFLKLVTPNTIASHSDQLLRCKNLLPHSAS